MNWNENLDELLKIAVSAGTAILEIYHSEDFGIESKVDESPLTKADKKANDIICAGLIKLFPEIPIISEENKEIPFETRKDYSYFWLVDPLDGTKEFIKRNGEFTVNIALIHVNKVVGGVVYTPVTNELFYAFKGTGAYMVSSNSKAKLKANKFSIEKEHLKVVCSRSHMNEETREFLQGLKNPELVSKGSSLKFLIIANGQADVYPRLAPTMEWDTAAAQIILEEAGGIVLNCETRKTLQYNKEVLRNPNFIAYGELQK